MNLLKRKRERETHCLCPVTHEQSSPGDKDGVSMSLTTLNSTPEAGLAIDTAECPYPNKGD